MDGRLKPRLRVLVVDDDDDVRENMVEILSFEADVEAASSADEAYRAIDASRFDVVVTDLRLGLDSTAARTVLTRARARGASVVVASGATEEEIDRELKGAKPDAVIVKPHLVDGLERLMSAWRAT